MATEIPIQGTCDARFERVREAFIENFRQRGDLGAAAAVTLEGRLVVDLWGGWTDKARTVPWSRDTLVNIYSTTKGLTAICAHRLVDQGRLDLDAPVSRYWPEFTQAGKEKLPVRFLLSHQAGLPAIKAPLPNEAIFDWDAMAAALAAQEPWWEPGTRHGYHALTFGWLVGEIIRRITGKSLGSYFRDEVAGPLGLDAHIGLDAKHDARVAPVIPAPPPPAGEFNLIAEFSKNPESMGAKALFNPRTMLVPGAANSRAWRGAEIPAANGHTTARALARLYGVLACGGALDGVKVLAPAAIERCHTELAYGPDAVLMISTRLSLGFMLSQPGASLGPNPHSFGHPGAGGSLGYADPDAGIGFGYTMNQMGSGLLINPRPAALIEAIYASL